MRRCILFNMYQRIRRSFSLYLIILFLTIIIVILLAFHLSNIQYDCSSQINVFQQQKQYKKNYNSSLEKPVIFIGGMPRSGTTLMRAILDSHPQIHCGEETRVIPRILGMRAAWRKSPVEWNRLLAAGINDDIINSAVRAFISEILVHHGQDADVLCDKDPFVLKFSSYVSSIFPNSKFLLLIRDARAVIHSVISRKVSITGFSATDYRQNLRLWNKGMEAMVEQCTSIGKNNCLSVYYEQLVLQPKITIGNVLKFLNLPWVDNVLHHEEFIGKKISLSKIEHSSDQVIKPINLEALTKWVENIPNDVKNEIDTLAPMLKKLGYDTQSAVPTYGVADQLVLDNMKNLKENAAIWETKAKAYARKLANDTSLFANYSTNRTVL